MRTDTVTFVARFVTLVVVLLLGFSSDSVAGVDFNGERKSDIYGATPHQAATRSG